MESGRFDYREENGGQGFTEDNEGSLFFPPGKAWLFLLDLLNFFL